MLTERDQSTSYAKSPETRKTHLFVDADAVLLVNDITTRTAEDGVEVENRT